MNTTIKEKLEQHKNISTINTEVLKKRLAYMGEKTKEYIESDAKLKITFSESNTKTGALVPSVSIRPILDCKNCKACAGLCYDIRNVLRYNNIIDSRCKNYAIYCHDPKDYFTQISEYCKNKYFFRWHVGGDLLNYDYLLGVVKVAKENKHCKFLIFTKCFDLVNSYLDSGKKIPRNLQIIFSGWVGLTVPNPYNLPTSHPIFKDGTTSAADGAKLCTGDCSECAIKNRNCWKLKKGEQVVFIAH